VARFEHLIDKKKKVLIILNWWWEKNIQFDEDIFEALIRCFVECKNYCGMEKVEFKNKENTKRMKSVNECA